MSLTTDEVRAYCQRRADQMRRTRRIMERNSARSKRAGGPRATKAELEQATAAAVAYEQVVGWIDRGGDP